MKKIRCPRCAVVNLEKFVSYPHCAGCGALLTEAAPPRVPWAAWKKPLGPLLWATVAGLAGAAAVGAAMLLTRPVALGQMRVEGQIMRQVAVGQSVTLWLTLDTFGNRSRELKGVSVRLNRDTMRHFVFESSDPKAQNQSRAGSGEYFTFPPIMRQTQIGLSLRAVRAGQVKLRATVRAENQLPADYNANVTVMPRRAVSKPNKT
jgi:hypothetical protein